MELKEIGALAIKIGRANGFVYEDDVPENLMLTVSELSEALEADRKSDYAEGKKLDIAFTLWSRANNIDKDDTMEGFKKYFEENIKNTFQDELADAVLRILGICEIKGIDLYPYLIAKMNYNTTRPQKHGGKKY